MINQPAWIQTRDNLVVHLGTGDPPLVIKSSDPHFAELVEYARNGEYEAINEMRGKPEVPDFIDGNFEIVRRRVIWNGQVAEGYLCDEIVRMHEEGYDITRLMNFFRNIQENPDERAKKDCFKFLEVNRLPITDDGHFVGYRNIQVNWKDGHTGTMDNSVGKFVQMKRQDCDPDPAQDCSRGLHIGGYGYFGGSPGGRMIACKVNPRDVVAVPNAYNSSKLRCCAFLVLEELNKVKFSTNDILAESKAY